MDKNHPGNPHNMVQSSLNTVLGSIDIMGREIGRNHPVLPGQKPPQDAAEAENATQTLIKGVQTLMETQIKDKILAQKGNIGSNLLVGHDQLVQNMGPQLAESKRLAQNDFLPYRMVKFDKDGFLDMGEFDPSLASAIDVGKELKILTPSPISSEYISPWESILTKCKVKDLHPGYVVVKLFADSFADLDPDVESVMYPVTQCPHKLPCGNKNEEEKTPFHVVLKDCSNIYVPGLLHDPEQEVHIVNEVGLESIPPEVEEYIWPVRISAPGLWQQQQKETLSITSA